MKNLGITSIITSALLALAITATPVVNAEVQLAKATSKISTQKAAIQQVNINTATEKQLTALPGIGEEKAKQIIAYRKKNGNFSSVKELMKVKGIGEKTFNALKDSVLIK